MLDSVNRSYASIHDGTSASSVASVTRIHEQAAKWQKKPSKSRIKTRLSDDMVFE